MPPKIYLYNLALDNTQVLICLQNIRGAFNKVPDLFGRGI